MRRLAMTIALVILITAVHTSAHAQNLPPGTPSTVGGPPFGTSNGTWSRETSGITSAEAGGANTECDVATFAGLVADLSICLMDLDWDPEEGGCLGPCRIWTRGELIDWFTGIQNFEDGVNALDALLQLACGDVKIEIHIYKAGFPTPQGVQTPPQPSTLGNVTIVRSDPYAFTCNDIRIEFMNAIGECAFSAALGSVEYVTTPAGMGHFVTLTGTSNGYIGPSGNNTPSFHYFDPATGGTATAIPNVAGGHMYWTYNGLNYHCEELITITVKDCLDSCLDAMFDHCEETGGEEPQPPNEETGEGNGDQTESGSNGDQTGGDTSGG